jgi:Bacterial nucleoid DNA-binding protein
MTQTQLVRELAEAVGTNNRMAKNMLESLASVAIRETRKSGVFVLPGIGRLVRIDSKARTGRNLAIGEPIKIPARKVVKFRVAKQASGAARALIAPTGHTTVSRHQIRAAVKE